MDSPAQLEFHSEKVSTVSVAGDFNDWCGSSKGAFDPSLGRMSPSGDYAWTFSLAGVTPGHHQFKFILDGEWETGPNRTFYLDEKGRLIDPTGGIVSVVLESLSMIRIRFNGLTKLPKFLEQLTFHIRPHGTILSIDRHPRRQGEGEIVDLHCRDLDISTNLHLDVKGLGEKLITRPVLPDGVFTKAFNSTKPLGARVEGADTVFRLFAPRAKSVRLHLAADPQMHRTIANIKGQRDSDGVWEMRVQGTHWGCCYGFHVDGPHGEGEGFDAKKLWPDPYAHAAVFHDGPAILIEPGSTGNGFGGWTDQAYRTPAKPDLVVWEASIRDLTAHPSSGVAKDLRGRYTGLAATPGLGTGIDHMKKLGINAIEFLPVFEFDDDPPGTYHWGYMPSLFFAPEASYARSPLGAQVHEFKALVDTLHRHGIAVLLDVVYNHTGAPQVLMGIDRKYFYRHDGSLTLHNFSGCGNDFKSENPMARRLIIDSLEHWVREYHVDGFRFDLAELLDLQTLTEIETRLRSVKPDVILIAEPWSFHGSNKGQLKGTGWANWNDDFRNRIKEAALGRGSADALFQVLRGSVDLWTASPWESVNYVESHDDFTLTDHLTERKDRDGSHPSAIDIRRNLFCAAAVLLSPGIPMIAQGQEMLRSKKGNGNSYNAGDGVNAVDYGLRDKYAEIFDFYRGLIELRKSPDGRLLRSADAAACRAVERLDGSTPLSTGLIWRDAANPREQLIVLFNADQHVRAQFSLKLPTGTWVRLVGDGRVFSRTSFNRREMAVSHGDVETGITLELPPIGVEVWTWTGRKH
ncbi:MAG TPA: alpha-amylase family glycosyl hydrolase [Candidatus Ozemobacteraceae bacterium]